MTRTQELRDAILQAAVKGELTNRLSNDSSASALICDIRKKKQQLLNDGRISRDNSFKTSDFTKDDFAFDIPDSWVWVRLGDICQKIGAGSTPLGGSKVYTQTGVMFIREQNVHNNGLNYSSMVYISSETNHSMAASQVRAKDILVNITGASIGRNSLVPDDFNVANVNQHVLIVRMVDERLRHYIHLCLCSPLIFNQMMCNQKGDKPGLSATRVCNFMIPIPPIEEQQRIVDRVNELLAKVDEFAEIENQLIALKANFPDDMRNAVLQAAMQGKLTEQRLEDGTGEEFYQQIQKEKIQLIKEGKIKEEKPLPEIMADEVPFDIPSNWKWCKLSALCSILNGDRSKNYPAKSTLSNEGIPFISALNLNGESVIKDNRLLCMSQTQYDKLGNGKLIKGDIVVCIRGSLGKHGRYPFDVGAIASSLVILRTFSNNNMLVNYIMRYLDTPLFFSEIDKYDNGTAQPNLAAKSLEQFLIPLPPLAEQQRIVERLDKLLPICRELNEN